jgi:lactoylglutathione lyase
MSDPVFRKVDCIQIPVPSIEAGLAFYCEKLGHSLIWKTKDAAGLRMPDSDAEIVIQTTRKDFEVDLLVASASAAAEQIEKAGGKILVAPFDIQIGKCVVVQDPFGNELILLDMSKGPLNTDSDGNVL